MVSETIDIQVGNLGTDLEKLAESHLKKNQTRACLFNLIIFSKDPRRAAYLHQIVQTILERFPCRIIFIQSAKNSELEYLRAFASNVIVSQGDAAIACDRINIDASEGQLHRVPFVILPLLIPDLPLYLVWGENPATESVILPVLQKYASRIVFDSECIDNFWEFCKKILEMLDHTRLEVRDVKWAQAGGWREILALTFESQERIGHLKDAREILITYNSHPTVFVSQTHVQAFYLQAWLAARMEWEFEKGEKINEVIANLYTQNGRPISINLLPQDIANIPSGEILGIQIATNSEHSYVLLRKEHYPQVTVHISSRDRCEMPFLLPLQELRTAGSLMDDIFYRKTSLHYRETLEMIVKASSGIKEN